MAGEPGETPGGEQENSGNQQAEGDSDQNDQVASGAYGEKTATGETPPSSAPEGTPDGSDDDIVARQLREAAEKETDPELKKKLWEEYRRYKAGAG